MFKLEKSRKGRGIGLGIIMIAGILSASSVVLAQQAGFDPQRSQALSAYEKQLKDFSLQLQQSEEPLRTWRSMLDQDKESVLKFDSELKQMGTNLLDAHGYLAQATQQLMDRARGLGHGELADAWTKELSGQEQQLAEWRKQREEWEKSVQEWIHQRQEWSAQLEKKFQDIDTLKKEVSGAFQEIERAKTQNNWQDILNSLTAKLADFGGRLSAMFFELQGFNTELTQGSQNLQASYGAFSKWAEFLEGWKKLLIDWESQISQMEAGKKE